MCNIKTFEDFDLSNLVKELHNQYIQMGKSVEDVDKSLPEILNMLKDKINVKFPCKTCGVKRSLNDLNHECSEEDTWLFSYIKSSNNNKNLKRGYKTRLMRKYPLMGFKIAFRGINFRTEEDYNKFMSEYEDGFYEFKEITSWTKSYMTAKMFARCVQKGTTIKEKIRRVELKKAIDEKSSITGYKGIILSIDLKKRDVLCDINNEEFGCYNESEVILLPGKYKVYIADTLNKEYGKILGLCEKIENSTLLEAINDQFLD